ncbi:MAG TPA: protoglobin domain-containing protein [Phycisphaerae bacterium]|nr:protoglobin domain-containing protein [Phycisphaerae bacterium]HRW52341.1 protoglobin domain-containing protein [Phycisphaerae bacterium]
MKRYLAFSEADAALLASVAQPIRNRIPAIVERFYGAVMRDSITAGIFTAQSERPDRLRRRLAGWIATLFESPYDDSHFNHTLSIGHMHVRVGLPQDFMFTAMNTLRLALSSEIQSLAPDGAIALTEALHKRLDLELAIMNHAYSDDLIDQMRRMEHDRFERRLGESRHLAIVGELAASIAHEVKNPLAGISGAMQVIRATLDDAHPHCEVIEEAMRQIDRLDTAIEDLLVYARPKPPARTQIDLVGLLRRVLIILREEPAFATINVTFEPGARAVEVEADESQIQQVLMNVMINAAHACSTGGRIDCRVSQSDDDGAQIEIDDDGVGIDEAIRDRVWEPFFTTKAKGTGLGLAICKRIVDAHNGAIRLANRPVAGTRVVIALPAAKGSSSS